MAVRLLYIFGPVIIVADRQHPGIKKRSGLLLIQCGALDLIGVVGQYSLGIGIDPGAVKFFSLNLKSPDQLFIFHRNFLLVFSLRLF